MGKLQGKSGGAQGSVGSKWVRARRAYLLTPPRRPMAPRRPGTQMPPVTVERDSPMTGAGPETEEIAAFGGSRKCPPRRQQVRFRQVGRRAHADISIRAGAETGRPRAFRPLARIQVGLAYRVLFSGASAILPATRERHCSARRCAAIGAPRSSPDALTRCRLSERQASLPTAPRGTAAAQP